jgi:hypothetical protein
MVSRLNSAHWRVYVAKMHMQGSSYVLAGFAFGEWMTSGGLSFAGGI